MIGHKICFMEKYGQLSLNYPCYPFLSGALYIMMNGYTLLFDHHFLTTVVIVSLE